MERLMENSIKVLDGTLAFWPFYNKSERISVSWITEKDEKKYWTNNGTTAFIHMGFLFVTPWTRQVEQTLEENGFRESSIYVPFSNGDYPLHENDKWVALKEAQERTAHENFRKDCLEMADKLGIGELPPEIMDKAFLIPYSGIKVHYLVGGESTQYPHTNGYFLDMCSEMLFCHYCCNNGKVVFVYRDGNTYVAWGYEIINDLERAGFKRTDMFVPFSNGETILDPVLQRIWQSKAS